MRAELPKLSGCNSELKIVWDFKSPGEPEVSLLLQREHDGCWHCGIGSGVAQRMRFGQVKKFS